MRHLLASRSVQRIILLSAIGMGVLICSWTIVRLNVPHVVEFQSVEDCARFSQQHGYTVHSGQPSPVIGPMFCVVADHPLSLKQINTLQKSECGLTPPWHGIVWVATIFRESETLCVNSLGGHWRVWGNVVAMGDPQLMDRLEALYLSNPERPAQNLSPVNTDDKQCAEVAC